MLMAIPAENEINYAVFALNKDSAPGPDGFGGAFFQAHWETVNITFVLLSFNSSEIIGCFLG
ncbi:hypothetical protein Fmac_011059 [Flemingia macrophylla]|uniref:Uncharacterized protein n=1 Tax=Flemingia macrophylla TaxID=520843 RepID=A0ABD1MLD3_9FABA